MRSHLVPVRLITSQYIFNTASFCIKPVRACFTHVRHARVFLFLIRGGKNIHLALADFSVFDTAALKTVFVCEPKRIPSFFLDFVYNWGLFTNYLYALAVHAVVNAYKVM